MLEFASKGHANSQLSLKLRTEQRKACEAQMEASSYLAVIKVVGAGGGGTNAVSRMVDAGLKGVEFLAVNTDAQALRSSEADVKLAIGQ